MPVDAKAAPWPEPLAALIHYRRDYRDVLGRPMRGTVTITGTARSDADGTVILPAPVTVELAAGVLEVDLPSDTYRIEAALRTVDGFRTSDTDTVTLT